MGRFFKATSPQFIDDKMMRLPFEKMAAVSPYTEKFAIWEYQTHLDPDSKNPGAAELSKAYRLWVKKRNINEHQDSTGLICPDDL